MADEKENTEVLAWINGKKDAAADKLKNEWETLRKSAQDYGGGLPIDATPIGDVLDVTKLKEWASKQPRETADKVNLAISTLKEAGAPITETSGNFFTRNLPGLAAVGGIILAMFTGIGEMLGPLLTGLLAIGGVAAATYFSDEKSILGGAREWVKEKVMGSKPDPSKEPAAPAPNAEAMKTGAEKGAGTFVGSPGPTPPGAANLISRSGGVSPS